MEDVTTHDAITDYNNPREGDDMIARTANASDLEVKTDPIPITIGYTPGGDEKEALQASEPRPDLNGVRCKFSNQPHIYLIDAGCRRHIPDPATFNNLFRNWEGIVIDNDINDIPEARAIQSGAVLSKGNLTPAVYLIDNGQKRHIISPAVMDKYNFAWNRIYVVPQVQIDAIPTGPSIS
jgi:hypothetical protein